MLRIFACRETYGRYLLGIERPMVRWIGLGGGKFRTYRKKVSLKASQERVHVGI